MTEGNITDLYALNSQYFVRENEKRYFNLEVKRCLNYPHLIEPIMSAVCSGQLRYWKRASVFKRGKSPQANCVPPRTKPLRRPSRRRKELGCTASPMGSSDEPFSISISWNK